MMIKSLPVPSVQELVSSKEPLAAVPSRYVCDKPLEPPLLPSDRIEVPVIDVQLLLAGDSSELQRLRSASHEWGFFQAVNHGVSSSLIERFKKEAKELFNLPPEEKKKYRHTAEEHEGFGQAFVVAEEQQLDWADIFNITTNPPFIRNSRLFASLPPNFSETLESYATETQNLALKIVDCLGQALGEETRSYFNACFQGINQAVRINYYPPCPEPEKVIGISPHSDGDALTILLQVNEVQGLQVKKDGKWVPINPIHDAFIVNIGDMLEILSNGVYRSIEHRGVVDHEKERLSVATFHNPGMDLEIGPAPSLVTAENPARFRRISTVDYLKGYLARKLEGKSYLEYMKIPEIMSSDKIYPTWAAKSTTKATATSSTINPTFPATKSQQYGASTTNYRPQPPPSRHLRCKCLFYSSLTLLTLILLAAVSSAVLYIVYRPHRPEFSVSSLQISNVNFSVSVTARNPNSKILLFYDPISVETSSSDAQLANGTIPGFTQLDKETTVLNVVLNGKGISAAKSEIKKVSELDLEIEMKTNVRFRVKKLRTKRFRVRVLCVGLKVIADSKGKFGGSVKTSEVKCKVKLPFKIWKWNFSF